MARQESGSVSTADLLSKLSGGAGKSELAKIALGRLAEDLVIRRVDDGGDEWELPDEVRNDILWLCDRQRLATPNALLAHIEDLASRVNELEQAVVAKDAELVLDLLPKLRDLIGDIANFCRSNRAAIVSSVMDLKAKQDGRTLRQRYRAIADLHDRYVEPMRDIVDDRGRLVAVLDDLQSALYRARLSFELDPSIPEQATRLIQRCVALSRQARADFLASSSEVLPLYAQYRKDTILAETAAACLDFFHREGSGYLPFGRVMPISNFRLSGLFSGEAVQSIMCRVGKVETEKRTAPRCDYVIAADPVISEDDVFARLSVRGNENDLLRWLFEQYADCPENTILETFSALQIHPRLSMQYADTPDSFVSHHVRYDYTPLRVLHVS